MVALNFSLRFAPPVAARVKRQSIRADKHRRLMPDTQLQLYTGLRTKRARKLVDDDPVITERVYVEIWPKYLLLGGPIGRPKIDQDEFARMDGFANYAEMVRWFQDTYRQNEFIGHCIRWDWPSGEGKKIAEQGNG